MECVWTYLKFLLFEMKLFIFEQLYCARHYRETRSGLWEWLMLVTGTVQNRKCFLRICTGCQFESLKIAYPSLGYRWIDHRGVLEEVPSELSHKRCVQASQRCSGRNSPNWCHCIDSDFEQKFCTVQEQVLTGISGIDFQNGKFGDKWGKGNWMKCLHN